MREEHGQVAALQCVALQDGLANLNHLTHCELEYGLPILMDVVQFLIYRLVRWRMQASAPGHIEGGAAGPIHLMKKVYKAGLVSGSGLYQHSPGTIAKNYTGRAIGVINDGRHHVRTDDQNFFVGSCADELYACLQSIDKTRAGGRYVEAPCAFGAQFVLHQTGGGGKNHIRRDPGHNDWFYISRQDSTLRQDFSGPLDYPLPGRDSLF